MNCLTGWEFQSNFITASGGFMTDEWPKSTSDRMLNKHSHWWSGDIVGCCLAIAITGAGRLAIEWAIAICSAGRKIGPVCKQGEEANVRGIYWCYRNDSGETARAVYWCTYNAQSCTSACIAKYTPCDKGTHACTAQKCTNQKKKVETSIDHINFRV